MSTHPLLLALCASVVTSACQSPSEPAAPVSANDPPTATAPNAQAKIRGRAMYFEKIKMAPGADFSVQLIDNQLADNPAAVIAQAKLNDVAGPPYEFTLHYDPAKLRANGSYGLHAALYGADGGIMFVTDTRIPWTPGTEDVGEFRMTMVRAGSGAPPPLPTQTSPWDEARSRNVAFRGIGNEPGWMVEVDRGESPAMRAQLDYGERKIEIAHAQGLSSTPGFGGKLADGTDVVLRIERKPCSDGMSDETYPATARLTVGNKTYDGCGRFLFE